MESVVITVYKAISLITESTKNELNVVYIRPEASSLNEIAE